MTKGTRPAAPCARPSIDCAACSATPVRRSSATAGYRSIRPGSGSDLFAFERLDGPSRGQAPDRAFALYRGPFLPDDLDESWAAVTRQRCQRQFEHVVLEAARVHEDHANWDDALDCYTEALSRNETAESFHRGRMRCLASLGREADALAAYSQLRRLLAVRLGSAPSSETNELAERIRSSCPDCLQPAPVAHHVHPYHIRDSPPPTLRSGMCGSGLQGPPRRVDLTRPPFLGGMW